MKFRKIFDPSDGMMNTLALASGSGTNFYQSVLESREPGSNFSVDYLLTDKEFKNPSSQERIGALKYAADFKIPHNTVNGYWICGSWKKASQTVEGRILYEKKSEIFNHVLYQYVSKFEKRYKELDIAILAGYMRLFKGAMMRRFNNTAINVHPASLEKLNRYGERRVYVGDNAVFDALSAGEERTRSCVIIVTPGTDAGPILASGPWVDYSGPRPVTQEDADKHQERQKELSDWKTLRFVLREMAKGKFALSTDKFHIDGNPVVLYDGQELPYQGYELAA